MVPPAPLIQRDASHIVLALDMMSGDGGLPVLIEGAAQALALDNQLRFLMVGDAAAIEAALAPLPALAKASTIRHADDVIDGSEKPAQAIRRAKTTSMGGAIASVKSGEADAALSAGNTGALMAMAKLSLRTLPGIDRPALAAMLPTLGTNDVIMLDLGANTECDARNLVEFAIMGAIYAQIALGLPRPRVRLLNIGTEAVKGTDGIRRAAALLRDPQLPLAFEGFVEGDRLARGEVDVIVTDGFSGNIALKTAEGTARFVADLIRRSFASSIRSKIGFLISRPATKLLRHHLDPNQHNGALFLGLNGIVVKSHGGANATGIANAIGVAAKLAQAGLTRKITDGLAQFPAHSKLVQPTP